MINVILSGFEAYMGKVLWRPSTPLKMTGRCQVLKYLKLIQII